MFDRLISSWLKGRTGVKHARLRSLIWACVEFAGLYNESKLARSPQPRASWGNRGWGLPAWLPDNKGTFGSKLGGFLWTVGGHHSARMVITWTPRNTLIVDDTVDVCRANPNNSIQCSRFLADLILQNMNLPPPNLESSLKDMT